MRELLGGEVRVVDIREPNEVDLLGRQQVETDIAAASPATYRVARSLVTGAGGSIGSELCRQIVRFEPAELMMIDRDESALHAVQLSLEGRALLDSPTRPARHPRPAASRRSSPSAGRRSCSTPPR